MSSNRTHNRAFEKAKQAFFEEGKRLDSRKPRRRLLDLPQAHRLQRAARHHGREP